VQALDRFQGALDRDAYVPAWQQAIDQHDLLRTTFALRGREWHQVVRGDAQLAARTFDWRGLSSDEQQARLSDYLHADRLQPFDLQQAPPIRLMIATLSDTSTQVVLTRNYLCADGLSSRMLRNQLDKSYGALVSGRNPSNSRRRPPSTAYADWLLMRDGSRDAPYWPLPLLWI